MGHHLTDGWIYRSAVYVLLIAIAYVFLYPLLRMLSMTFMSTADLINPEIDWVPQNWSFMNLRVAWRVMDMPLTIFNSLWFTGTLALAQTFVSAMTGFAFARYQFKFKNFWFMMILLSFVIPVPLVLIPRWMMFTTVQNLAGIKTHRNNCSTTLYDHFRSRCLLCHSNPYFLQFLQNDSY
jgi:multiple sugar transport system permease protein